VAFGTVLNLRWAELFSLDFGGISSDLALALLALLLSGFPAAGN
jgi:hypothetical protein